MTPAVYVETLRVERARVLLESTHAQVDDVASRCGFGTVETMRRAFRRRLGVSPGHYRDRFRPPRARSKGPPDEDRHTDVRPSHRARRDRARTRCCRACPAPRCSFVAAEPGPEADRQRGCSRLHADVALADLTDPDILLIPGGYGTRKLMKDEAMLGLGARRARELAVDHLGLHRLARAGRRRACSRGWRPPPTGCRSTSSRDVRRDGRPPRVVEQGKVITAAGVSAGIDMALVLASRVAGRRGGAGDPARDRVRPAAALRHGLAGQGAGGDPGARTRCRACGSRQLGAGGLAGRRAQAVLAGQPSRGFGSGVTDCSIRSRRCSKAGGSDRRSPRCSAGSSVAKPGPSVAISNSTPLGSRK